MNLGRAERDKISKAQSKICDFFFDFFLVFILLKGYL